jgi:hypothetical protein
VPRPRLILATALTALSCTVLSGDRPCDDDDDCDTSEACVERFCGPAAEGEGDAAEGEGDAAEGEGEAGEGEGEGDVGEGEGEGDAGEGEGEGDAGEGEGEAGEGEGEGEPPPTSCREVLARDPLAPSGEYTLDGPSGPITVTCEMTLHDGGWALVVDDDYTNGDPCPAPFVPKGSLSACGRDANTPITQASFAAPIAYTEVLGSIQGIAFDSLDAFAPPGVSVDVAYVDGVSVTTGAPRVHLFTLAASHEGTDNDCPCDDGGAPDPPPAIGDRWSCDRSAQTGVFDVANPLWDDVQRCLPLDQLDRYFQSAPLPAAVLDPIDVRLQIDDAANDEDLALMHLELYVR